MIRAIVWKEIREQWLIAAMLVVLGSGVLVAAAVLGEPPQRPTARLDVLRSLGAGPLATLMLAVTAGMVCGGAVFAAEREGGTMPFLDSLPASRWRLWRAKLLAGLVLAVVQIGLLVGVAAALGLVPTTGWAVAVAIFALLAFVWGMFGSTTARTTLGSVGWAIPTATLTATVVLVFIAIFIQTPGAAFPRPREGMLFLVVMFAVPITLSAWLFTGPDRERAADADPSADSWARGRARIGFPALFWLATRQLRVPFLTLSSFALLSGLSMLAPGVQPALTWPGLALLAGVLTGVLAFADEQIREAGRFWGEQRLPVGRAWVVKIGLHLLFCLWLLLLLALPLIIRTQATGRDHELGRNSSGPGLAFRSLLLTELGSQSWKFLLVPAVYGFAAGHLCGLVFRKLVVACGVAGILGGVGAAMWGPSLLSGGVQHWQLWLPPIVILVTARLLLPAWTADRLVTRRPLLTLSGGCVAAFLVMAVGIAYRVLEIPDHPNAEADVAHIATLPSFDVNAAGRDFRTASERYARAFGIAGPPYERRSEPRRRAEEQLERVAQNGWYTGDSDLGELLDALFVPPPDPHEDTWYVLAERAAGHPPGVFEYPQAIRLFSSRDTNVQNAQRMAVGLLVRGLQKQAAGDPAAFVDALRTTLVLSRTMRNGSTVASFQTGADIERIALFAVDRWLEVPPLGLLLRTVLAPFPYTVGAAAAADGWAKRVLPTPELLRRATRLVEEFDPAGPFDSTPHFLAERYAIRETLRAPSQWLPATLTPPGKNPDTNNPEIDLVTFAWAVPWERERTRRLIGLGFERGRPADFRLLIGRPGAMILARARVLIDPAEADRLLRAVRRAAILKLGLWTFRDAQGKYPDSLAELTASGYLRRLPPDPHDETREFGYRISPSPNGEMLRQPPPPPGPTPPPGTRVPVAGGPTSRVPPDRTSQEKFVPAGQAIIWSVGSDRVAQGGTNLPLNASIGLARAPDFVYLVPLGPNH